MSMNIELAEQSVALGIARARRWLGNQIADLPGVRDLRQLAEALHGNELELERMGQYLVGLRDRGLASPSDFAAYEVARQNLYASHQRFRRLLQRIFERHPEVLGHLPSAKLAPKVTADDPPRGAVNGLGAAPAAGAAAAAAAPAWMMGAIVVIILASIVLAITLVVAGIMLEEVVRDVLVTRAQLAATEAAWERRRQVYDSCIEGGGTPTACGSTASSMVPMPPEVLRNLPRPGEWVKWLTIGLITVTVAGLGIWGISKLRSSASSPSREISGGGLRAGAFKKMSPEQFLASDGGGYHMAVSGVDEDGEGDDDDDEDKHSGEDWRYQL